MSTLKFDTGAEEHPSGLYQHDRVAETLPGLAAIGTAQEERYRGDGFLAVADAFSPEETAAALDGLAHLIMGGNPDFEGVSFEAKARDILETLGPEARQDAVRKLMHFVDFDSRLKAVSHHPELLRVVKRLLGGREPALFQDMALLKPPRMGREKPWHQDHAYFNFPIDTPVVGVWIALDEATLENGCMRMLAGGHKEGPRIHFKKRDWQICDTEMLGLKAVAVPLKPGGLVLFDGLIPHGTPTNRSPNRRRALQFHYAPTDAVTWAVEERLKVFGSEGKDVEC